MSNNTTEILEQKKKHQLKPRITKQQVGWSGCAMVLGKLPVPGHPTNLDYSRQGPTALTVGADGVIWTFFLSSIISLFFLPLSGRRPDID